MERKPWATIKDVVEGLIREYSPAGRKMLDAYYQAHPQPASRFRRGPRQRSHRSRRRAPPMISSSTSSSGDSGDDQPTTARRAQLERRSRRQVRRDAALAEQDA